jgi:thiol-disulfide isomerase/thioredoxin
MRRFAVGLLVMLVVGVPALAMAGTFSSLNLVLVDLGGKRVPLDTLLARGPVVLNFWATWCGPCRAEMPQLQKVYQATAPKGMTFCAVSIDQKMAKGAMEQFLKKAGFVVPVYRDETGALAKVFKVVAIPTTIVLTKTGDIHYQTKGYRPGDEILLKKKIEELLASSVDPTATPK